MSDLKPNQPTITCRVPSYSATFPTLNGVSVGFSVDSVWQKPDGSDSEEERYFVVAGKVTKRGETYPVEMKIVWPFSAREAVDYFWQRVRMRNFIKRGGELEMSCEVAPSVTLVHTNAADGTSTVAVVFTDEENEIRAEFNGDTFETLRHAMLGFR